jgi:hypothetical protein
MFAEPTFIVSLSGLCGFILVVEDGEEAGKFPRIQSSSHGLQYGQDWPCRQFPNDFNLTTRTGIRRGLFEPPYPRSAACRAATAGARDVIEDATDCAGADVVKREDRGNRRPPPSRGISAQQRG